MTKYRAGIIGRTGGGDYGHGLDRAFEGIPDVEVVAIADNNSTGLRDAGKRLRLENLYLDFHQMLERERLDLVVVAPRWVDCHAEMVVAAAESGVRGIFCEKPLAATLAEADVMVHACERNGVRMVVAHRRACAYEQHAKRLVDEGAIGQVHTMRAHGKSDHRAGAMDLTVLGTHMMDSMRYIANSNVSWAYGHVTQDGREVSPVDFREEKEGVGLVAGNGVTAYYVFENGITAHYDSYPGDLHERSSARVFGFEIYGLNGIISLRNSPRGEMYLYPHGLWIPGEENGSWERIYLNEWEYGPDGQPWTGDDYTRLSNHMIAKELIASIEEDRDVRNVSSLRDSRAALEMVMAVHESQRLRTRVSFPLENRDNPYDTWNSSQS